MYETNDGQGVCIIQKEVYSIDLQTHTSKSGEDYFEVRQDTYKGQGMKGVYILLNGFEVIYIGSSVNIERRLTGHKNKDYDHYVIIECKRHKMMEKKLIRLINPPLNIVTYRDVFTTNLCINPKLAKKVKASAKVARHSMNTEIELILQERYA